MTPAEVAARAPAGSSRSPRKQILIIQVAFGLVAAAVVFLIGHLIGAKLGG